MDLQIASKKIQNLMKNEPETKSTKHVENVLNLIPLDLQETRFRMEWLPKIAKTRGADKCQKYQNMCRNEANIHEKSVPERNKKRCLNTEPQKSENTPKMPSTLDPKNEVIFGVLPLVAPLVAQAAFDSKKWAPSAPTMRSRIEK